MYEVDVVLFAIVEFVADLYVEIVIAVVDVDGASVEVVEVTFGVVELLVVAVVVDDVNVAVEVEVELVTGLVVVVVVVVDTEVVALVKIVDRVVVAFEDDVLDDSGVVETVLEDVN